MPGENANTTVLLKAVQFAAFKHRKQRCKDVDASPYINHPIGVAYLLADVGGIPDMDTVVAAILHDTLEDTETTSAELDEKF
jgi:GTP diphosphokinase / guanosine-3',5'-bis(diphosphate) 3'-diphosphatase